MADTRKQDDEQYRNEREAELGELFADALTRIEAGETTDVILDTCPNEHRPQLRSMLLLGEALFAQQHAPMPTRSTARRTAQRQAFLQQVAQVRAEQLPAPAVAPAAAIDSTTPAPTPKGMTPRNGFNLGQWLADGWSKIQEATTVRGYSLAPLLATLLIALIASLATVQVTQAAVPGDLTYRVKDWARSAELVLTPPDLRQPVVERREREFEQEVATVAQRNEQRTDADLNRLVVQETLTLPFRGFNGRTLAFGDLTVFPSYQPNANDLVTRNPMAFDGDLVEGALVELTVLILPGRTDFVQGVYAKVIAPPPGLPPAPTPAPEAAPSAPPVSTRPALPPCTPLQPAGWGTYTVRPGDTISKLAGLTEADIRQVSGVNCLESDFISSGQAIYLPPFVVPTVIPPVETATPTLLPPETPTETPAETAAETPTAAPTASKTPQAPTVEPSATSEQTLEPTAQPTETALPNPNATPVPTLEPTTGPGATSTATETAEPSTTPTTTQEPTVTVPAATPQPGATSEASATPEGGVTVEATATPVIEITPTESQTEATATATSQEPTRAPPTATSLPDTPTATIAVTVQPTVESAIATAASTPTAKATAPQVVAPTEVPPPAPTSAPPPAVATVQPPSAPTEDAGGTSTDAADDGQTGDQSSAQP